MKKTLSLIAIAGLCVGVVNASMITETVVVAQQSVNSGSATVGNSDINLDFIGSQFDPTLGTLNSVDLALTANLSDSTVGGLRTSAGSDAWNINWNYSGSVTLSSLPLSSTWTGSGPTSVNPPGVFPPTFQYVPIGLSDPTPTGTSLTSSLSQFIGSSTFDLAALLQTSATWGSTPNNGTEFGNFNPYAGVTLQVTYNYTPVPEPTTCVVGAMLLLPFGTSTLRMLRKSRTA
jgi:hypothetical protein